MPTKKKKNPKPVKELALKIDMLNSEVFRSLNQGSINVYFDMQIKHQNRELKGKSSRIPFSYGLAKKKGIAPSTFRRATKELREKGFIEIVKTGTGGPKPSSSKYKLSNRWKKYGTDDFITK